MSGSESDSERDEPFVEHEDKPTALPFDKGGVPIYIALLWVGFIITYVVVLFFLVLPDLRAWMAH